MLLLSDMFNSLLINDITIISWSIEIHTNKTNSAKLKLRLKQSTR